MPTPELTDDQKGIVAKLKETAGWPGRDEQIELCGELLKHALDALLKEKKGRLAAHKKAVLKELIRKSSESTDYKKTVDFVTSNALELMELKKKNISFKKGLSHEHMMPCEAVFQTIIRNESINIVDFLKTTGFRALVSRKDPNPSEHKRLDAGKMKTGLPINIPSGYPEKYYVFARYEAAGIFENLIPANERGEKLMADYLRERCQYSWVKL